MRFQQGMVQIQVQVQLRIQQWAWWRLEKPEGSGTQEGKTYREEAAEREAAAADDDDGAAAAGQKPVGTGAAVREGREGEEGDGNEGRTIDFMVHNDDDEMLLETSSGFGKLGTWWEGGTKEWKSKNRNWIHSKFNMQGGSCQINGAPQPFTGILFLKSSACFFAF